MKKHILIIDENPRTLELFSEVLSGSEIDCKCAQVSSCEQAEQILKAVLPDTIFVQLDSDITNGLEFVRNIKKNKRFRKIQAVVYSSHMPYYNFLARGHGADLCMQAPRNPEDIRKVIESLLIVNYNRHPL